MSMNINQSNFVAQYIAQNGGTELDRQSEDYQNLRSEALQAFQQIATKGDRDASTISRADLEALDRMDGSKDNDINLQRALDKSGSAAQRIANTLQPGAQGRTVNLRQFNAGGGDATVGEQAQGDVIRATEQDFWRDSSGQDGSHMRHSLQLVETNPDTGEASRIRADIDGAGWSCKAADSWMNRNLGNQYYANFRDQIPWQTAEDGSKSIQVSMDAIPESWKSPNPAPDGPSRLERFGVEVNDGVATFHDDTPAGADNQTRALCKIFGELVYGELHDPEDPDAQRWEANITADRNSEAGQVVHAPFEAYVDLVRGANDVWSFEFSGEREGDEQAIDLSAIENVRLGYYRNFFTTVATEDNGLAQSAASSPYHRDQYEMGHVRIPADDGSQEDYSAIVRGFRPQNFTGNIDELEVVLWLDGSDVDAGRVNEYVTLTGREAVEALINAGVLEQDDRGNIQLTGKEGQYHSGNFLERKDVISYGSLKHQASQSIGELLARDGGNEAIQQALLDAHAIGEGEDRRYRFNNRDYNEQEFRAISDRWIADWSERASGLREQGIEGREIFSRIQDEMKDDISDYDFDRDYSQFIRLMGTQSLEQQLTDYYKAE